MTSTWLLYVICALMLLAAIVAVLPTVLRAKNDVNGEALDREATALAGGVCLYSFRALYV